MLELRHEGLKALLPVLVLVGCSLCPAAEAAGPGVEPLGVFPLVLPGLPASAGAEPKALLWCHGVRLVGIVVPSERRRSAGAADEDRLAPTAYVLRDGRCEPDADGRGVSFGFLVPMQAWVFESAARTRPEELTTWLLHRFAGAASARQLTGVLVQVEVSHPGYAFRESKVAVDILPESQASFTDETAWLDSVTRTFSLARSEP